MRVTIIIINIIVILIIAIAINKQLEYINHVQFGDGMVGFPRRYIDPPDQSPKLLWIALIFSIITLILNITSKK
jgi:hypothetical protein